MPWYIIQVLYNALKECLFCNRIIYRKLDCEQAFFKLFLNRQRLLKTNNFMYKQQIKTVHGWLIKANKDVSILYHRHRGIDYNHKQSRVLFTSHNHCQAEIRHFLDVYSCYSHTCSDIVVKCIRNTHFWMPIMGK